MQNSFFSRSLLAFIAFVSISVSAQFKIPEKPSFQTSVYDYAKVLDESERSQLEQKLIRYSDSTSTQIVFISVPTIENEDINLLGPRWAQAWGIGQAKEDNGVLVLWRKRNAKLAFIRVTASRID